MFTSFKSPVIPPLEIGCGTLKKLSNYVESFQAKKILVIISGSLVKLAYKDTLTQLLQKFDCIFYERSGEPSPSEIDDICERYKNKQIDLIIGIGGGSTLDAAKAVSAMIAVESTVLDHLEGVGRGLPHPGKKLPLIAIPSTSGTGSEATKNAVLSKVGLTGYKKSLRHDRFVPDQVIVDGEIITTCSKEITAACGLDALTQLIEPFLSPKASALSDAMAWSGLEALVPNLMHVCAEGANEPEARLAVAYGAFMSGVALAQAGLGVVHGFASPLGGLYPISHGVICGTLLAEANRVTYDALKQKQQEGVALRKISRLGQLFADTPSMAEDKAQIFFLDTLYSWTEKLSMPRLSSLGVKENDFETILQQTASRDNPIELTYDEKREILVNRY